MVSSGRNGTKEWVRAAQAAPPSHSVRAGCQHALPIQPSTVEEWTARSALLDSHTAGGMQYCLATPIYVP